MSGVDDDSRLVDAGTSWLDYFKHWIIIFCPNFKGDKIILTSIFILKKAPMTVKRIKQTTIYDTFFVVDFIAHWKGLTIILQLSHLLLFYIIHLLSIPLLKTSSFSYLTCTLKFQQMAGLSIQSESVPTTILLIVRIST